MPRRRSWGQAIVDAFDAVEQRLLPRRHFRRQSYRNHLRLQERMVTRQGFEEDRMSGKSWLGYRLSPNSALEDEMIDARTKAEEFASSTPVGAGFVRGRVTNVIGTGMRPQSRIREAETIDADRAKLLNEQLEEIYLRVAPCADTTGRMSLRMIQRLVQRIVDRSGECFLVLSDKPIGRKPIPLAIDVVAPVRVMTPPEIDGQENVRLGVRHEPDGTPISYFIYKHDPDDKKDDTQAWEEVPAHRVLHIFEPEEPGQYRGWPMATPTLKTMRNVADFEEAVLIGKQVQACFSAFIPVTDPVAAAASAASSASAGLNYEELTPGAIYRYNAEVEGTPSFANPGAGAGSDLDTYLRSQNRKIAAGLNYPYEMLFKDYGGLNFAATRAALIEGRLDFAASRQLMGELFLDQWWMRLVFESVLLGLVDIDPEEYLAQPWLFDRHLWIPQAQDWVDPAKDVLADEKSVINGFKSRTQVAAARGLDEQEVQEQRTRELIADVKRELLIAKARADAEKELNEYRESLGLKAEAPDEGDEDRDEGRSASTAAEDHEEREETAEREKEA